MPTSPNLVGFKGQSSLAANVTVSVPGSHIYVGDATLQERNQFRLCPGERAVTRSPWLWLCTLRSICWARPSVSSVPSSTRVCLHGTTQLRMDMGWG